MDQLLIEAGRWILQQGPWAFMTVALAVAAYKLVGKILEVVERNSAAFARVESIMDKVMEKLDA